MGGYLDKPIKDKNPEWGGTDMAWWGICGM